MHRVADILSLTAEGSGSGLLANKGGRGHLAAGHAVCRVVDEDNGDMLATVGSIHNLGEANGREVAVALISVDDGVLGSSSLEAGGNCRSTAVRSVHFIHIPVTGSDAAAADTDDADGLIEDTELFADLGDGLGDAAVHAAGAETADDLGLQAASSLVYFLHYNNPLLQSLDGIDNLVTADNNATGTAESLYRNLVAGQGHSILHILDHLGGNGHFYIKNDLDLLRVELLIGFIGEGIDDDRTDEADLDAIFAHSVDDSLANTGGSAVCGQDDLSILSLVELDFGVFFGPAIVHGFSQLVGILKAVGAVGVAAGALGIVGVDINSAANPRVDLNESAIAVALAVDEPVITGSLIGGQLLIGDHGGQNNRFHHGADATVGQNHYRVAISLGIFECLVGHVNSFLNGGGSENDHFETAVALSLRGLPVVLLRGLNGAAAGAAAHDVDNNGRQSRTCDIGDTFGLQGNTARGG
ncbi:hypothetical protein SDC9_98569 [bioreactor metagenome]|uniref:NAD-specific glutamate dehydrogenase n=1 Tax=bioreactor metagenome TaxID=1076179 RepID=A0A645AGJ0_9ZZZZ